MIEAGIPPYQQKATLAKRASHELRTYVDTFLFERGTVPDAYENLMEGLNDVKITLMAMGDHTHENVMELDPVQRAFRDLSLSPTFAQCVEGDFDQKFEACNKEAAGSLMNLLTAILEQKSVPVPKGMLDAAAASLGKFHQLLGVNAALQTQSATARPTGESYERHL